MHLETRVEEGVEIGGSRSARIEIVRAICAFPHSAGRRFEGSKASSSQSAGAAHAAL